MKKIISILLLATFCIFTQLHAQNRADELMKQAQENLTKNLWNNLEKREK